MIGDLKLIQLFIILLWTGVIVSFDPLSVMGIGAGAGSILSAGWNNMYCKFTECCDGTPHNLTSKTSFAGWNIWQILNSCMKRLIYW
jgi:hypothetical protein